jgi:hypothetical protein
VTKASERLEAAIQREIERRARRALRAVRRLGVKGSPDEELVLAAYGLHLERTKKN